MSCLACLRRTFRQRGQPWEELLFMEIKNDTNDDATVRVSGGGSGIAQTDCEVLSVPAKGSVSHDPKPPGPWKVAFRVGSRQTRKTVRCATDRVTLSRVGTNGFRAET